MKLCICFVLFKIVGANSYIDHQNAYNENQRSVNVALETILEFSNKDNSADLQFLDNVNNFISKVKTVIDKKKYSRRDFTDRNVENLTDFIQAVIAIINSYDEPEFQDAIEIFDEEIRKYHYRGCKFYELTGNYEIRKSLAVNLGLIRGKPGTVVKTILSFISQTLKDENYDKCVKDLVDYVNSLYREVSRDKFRRVLTDLDLYPKSKSKRTDTNLVSIIRDAIRSILFDHYTNLNPNARRELKYKMESCWKQYQHVTATVSKTYNVSTAEIGRIEIKNPDNMVDIKKIDIPKKIEPHLLESNMLEPKLLKLKIIEPYIIETKPIEHKKEEVREIEYKKWESKKNEHRWIDGKRFQIKKSDYKTTGNMRDGMEVENTIEQVNGKDYVAKYTKIDNGEIDTADMTKPLATAPKFLNSFHRTTKKTKHKNVRTLSTDEMITEETFEENSIEPYEEEEDATGKPYLTLYPEIITYKPTKKEHVEKIIHRSHKAYKSAPVGTLWVEESTGRLQGSRKLTTRSRPKSQNNPKYKPQHKFRNKPENHRYTWPENYKLKKPLRKPKGKSKHESENISNHKPKYMREREPKQSPENHKTREKHQSDYDEDNILKAGHKSRHKSEKHKKTHSKHEKAFKPKFRMNPKHAVVFENNANIEVQSTNMELYEYKKMFASISKTAKHELTTVKPTTQLFLKHTNLPFTQSYSAPNRGKRFKILPRKKLKDFRKSIAPPVISDEGISIEQFVRDEKLHHTKKTITLENSNINNTALSSTLFTVDEYVMKKIKDLERELTDVKNRIGDSNNGTTVWKSTSYKYDTKNIDYKSKDFKDKAQTKKIFKSQEIKQIHNNSKVKTDEASVFNGDIKAMKEKVTNVDKTEVTKINYDNSITKAKTVTVNDNSSTISNKVDTNKDATETEIRDTKYIDAINTKENEIKEIGKVKLVNTYVEKNGRIGDNNNEDVDVWKDTFKKIKIPSKKTASPDFRETARLQAETTEIALTTPEATNIITAQNEMFIAVSMTTETPDNKKNLYVPMNNVVTKNQKLNQPQIRHSFETNNVSDAEIRRQNVRKKIQDTFKINNDSTNVVATIRILNATKAISELSFAKITKSETYFASSSPKDNSNVTTPSNRPT